MSPTLMMAVSGRTCCKNASVLLYREPWCPTTSTSISGRSNRSTSFFSVFPAMSPVIRASKSPAEHRKVSPCSFRSPAPTGG